MDEKLIFLGLIATIFLTGFTKAKNEEAFLNGVLDDLEKIESATYLSHREAWQVGDTTYAFKFSRYVESYRNKLDTTIGSTFIDLNTDDKSKLEFAYDGNMRAIAYHEHKVTVLDSFTKRKLSFKPVSPPFYNYTENIIQYILKNNDSTTVTQIDVGEDIFVRLTIHEDQQVEFHGNAYYVPNSPYIFDYTSIYEIWIDKETNLPYKVRREMSHDISVEYVSDPEFNKLNIEDFVAADYFPKDYEVRPYGQKNERKSSALIGTKAADWNLTSSDDQAIALSDLKSKVVLLQFTSVSCGPCRVSIPFLKKLSASYSKEDFDFVAIECTSKNTNVLNRYMERNNFDYPFLLSSKKVLKSYAINAFPIFIILDENRVIQKVITGYGKETTDAELKREIDRLI